MSDEKKQGDAGLIAAGYICGGLALIVLHRRSDSPALCAVSST